MPLKQVNLALPLTGSLVAIFLCECRTHTNNSLCAYARIQDTLTLGDKVTILTRHQILTRKNHGNHDT
ncbi:hypothetical protein THIOM_005543 [Candidatus Thiomargarita nelsonii]|uniref:Uncharacterized protein n=1 Tax=Candidatus Thiomargarita nelsonii TaxID=1003181 RepID=A0A176RSX6_9GAMM|nr:hypothetical protein THIOM_005543 [Candidatus Thiomargarita nelsonii]